MSRNIITELKERAAKLQRTIILSESWDPRMVIAADKTVKEGFCKVAMIGKTDEVYKLAPVKPIGESDILKPAITQARFSDWVDCLGKEIDLLKGVMKSDMKRWRDYLKDDLAIPSASLQMSFFDLEGFG